MKNTFILCIIAVVLLSACKKSNTENRENNCKLISVQSTVDSASIQLMSSQTSFSYTGDRVTKKENLNGDFSAYEYDGNKIIKIHHNCADGTCYSDDSLNYNNDGTLKSIETYFFNSFAVLTKVGSYHFLYNNGKMSKIILYNYDYNNNPVDSAIQWMTNFTYNNSNIIKVESEDFTGEKTILTFSYDNKKNYLNTAYKGNWLLLAKNRGYFDHTFLSFILSENNVTSINAQIVGQPSFTSAATYKLDNRGNLDEFIIESPLSPFKSKEKFQFTCP